MKLTYKKVNCSNAMNVLNEGLKAIDNGDYTFDLSEVQRIDSSAIAVAVRWKQEAEKKKASIKFINVPENLNKLSDLYNVTDLLTS